MTRLRADLVLLVTALIWGTAFVAQKSGNDGIGVFAFIGARYSVTCLALLPFAWYEAKKQTAPLTRRDYLIAGGISLCVCVGAVLQQIGLTTTTATNGGFLTAIYAVFVPLIAWLVTQQRPRLIVIAACALCVVGAWLLTYKGQAQHWAVGDSLILLASIAWAASIVLVPIFLERAPRPLFLSLAQSALCALVGIVASLWHRPVTPHDLIQAAPAILYAGLLSGGLAYTLQIIAQKHTPAAEAALILSLESVFAALAGAWLLHEQLTVPATIGCALILLGVLAVEIEPARRKRRR
jgi:drug/metabolite transporter (DMT)-like permease